MYDTLEIIKNILFYYSYFFIFLLIRTTKALFTGNDRHFLNSHFYQR